ncbi:ABC transporter substrate-binding protein [Sphaerisporangium sp. NPDC051017]|uniref:ABC transporter substrate-binding protein n=1 Tax=Sphaerisporangium sp. NPDC051017 TaxID=3154636 RepID=UPI0034420C77
MPATRRATVAATASLLALAAFAPGASAAEGDEITVAACPPGTMEPAELDEACGGEALGAMFTGLVEYLPGRAATRYAVASSITTKDNKVFTVRLKKGWRFHDGTEVKARNFVKAWSHGARESANGSYYFQHIAGFQKPARSGVLSGLKVIDDHAFTITLNEPFGGFVPMLGRLAFAPLPDSFFTSPSAYRNSPIGNGPYRFVSRTGEDVTVERYDDYGGPALPAAGRIVYRTYADWDAAYKALLDGQVDFAPNIPRATGLGGRVVNTPSGGIHVLNFPMRQPKISGNADFRRAISTAIPRETIGKEFGASRVPADSFVPPPALGARRGTCGEACAYDQAGARAALARARAAGFVPPKTFTIYYNGDAQHSRWAKLAATAATKALGGQVKVVAASVPTFADLLTRAEQGTLQGAYRWAWLLDSPHVSDVLATYRTADSSNHTGYSDKGFDALLAAADRTPSPSRAGALYRRAEKILVRDLPAVPLFFYRNVAGYSDRLSNVHSTLFGSLDVTSVRL